MDHGKEFRKYAVKHLGLNSIYVDKYMDMQAQNPVAGMVPNITGLTPNIIEERQMNAVAMDIFSRLMMDRIIFLGVPIYDDVANIIIGQLLFLESSNPNRDIQIYINSPGAAFTPVWPFTIPCNLSAPMSPLFVPVWQRVWAQSSCVQDKKASAPPSPIHES